jgi:hypothetical protein
LRRWGCGNARLRSNGSSWAARNDASTPSGPAPSRRSANPITRALGASSHYVVERQQHGPERSQRAQRSQERDPDRARVGHPFRRAPRRSATSSARRCGSESVGSTSSRAGSRRSVRALYESSDSDSTGRQANTRNP